MKKKKKIIVTPNLNEPSNRQVNIQTGQHLTKGSKYILKCLPFTIWGIHTLHIYRPLEKSQAKAFWKRLMSRYMKRTSNSVIPFHQEMWSPTVSLESKGGFHHASFWASATIKKLTASSPCLWNTWVKKPAKDADTLRPPCSKKPKFHRDTKRWKPCGEKERNKDHRDSPHVSEDAVLNADLPSPEAPANTRLVRF